MALSEESQHSLVCVLALCILAWLGGRGADVAYAIAASVGALVGGRAISNFAPGGAPPSATHPAPPPPHIPGT